MIIEKNLIYVKGKKGTFVSSESKSIDYCNIEFIDINTETGEGVYVKMKPKNKDLPDICSQLVVGDYVTVQFDLVSVDKPPLLVDITKIIIPSVLRKK